MKKKTIIAIILLLSFIIYSFYIMQYKRIEPFKIDEAVYESMLKVKDNAFLVIIAKISSSLIEWYILTPVLIVLLIIDFKTNLNIVITVLIAVILTLLIKNTVNRERPAEITRLVNIHSKSFPSGHALVSGSFFLMLLYTYKDKLFIVITSSILMFLVSISRLILNVHWFSDVVLGNILAVVIFLLSLSFHEMQTKNKIILASTSPRRKELLSKITKDFIIISSNINEKIKTKNYLDYVIKTSYKKANKIKTYNKNAIIISADTIVVLNNKIYGKEKSFLKALNHLLELNNKTHRVITATTILKNNEIKMLLETSYITFKDNTLKDILVYLNKNTYKVKAGSYGIQEEHNNLIKGYQGSYENIMGLDTIKLKEALNEII